MRAADLLGPTGPLASVIPGYEHRAGQLEMADAVENALGGDRVLLVEAGTGTGKTLAYLIPALLSGKKVVVSTGTKNLQDQIMTQDIPLLRQYLSVPFEVACMKGLSNYLCRRRYHEFVASPAADDRRFRHALPLLDAFAEQDAGGDKSTLVHLEEDDPVWPRVTSGSDTRVGKGCAYHDTCFVTKMKKQAQEANLIVVNHHLFFADLMLRSDGGRASVLPKFDAVIFDEAHQLEDTATRFLGQQVSSSQLEKLAEDAARNGEVGSEAAQQLASAAGVFFSLLPSGVQGNRTPIAPEVFTGRVEDALFTLDNALDRVQRSAEQGDPNDGGTMQLARRASKARDDLIGISETRNLGVSVAWTEPRGRHRALGTSPVDVSALLHDEVFMKTRAVVLTSATLTTSAPAAPKRPGPDRAAPETESGTEGPHPDEAPSPWLEADEPAPQRSGPADGFSFIRSRLGVEFDADALVVPSPFDYRRQAALYLPRRMPDPRSPEYAARARQEIIDLVELTGGGAFVLCTSVRAMRHLSQACAFDIPHPVLVQGQAPKQALLTRFRAAGDAVLFATMSFWEGVDVSGEALRLVIVDKLPFSVPADPLIAARCEALRERGVPPFMNYLVPSAALTLKQGFGRLIRSRRDTGVVALLDGRVATKGYGRAFLKALPDAKRCTTLDEVRAAVERFEHP